MSDTLFADDKSATPATPAADPAAQVAQPALVIPAEAAALIGEGRKYATVQAALASIPNAQSHISTLEAENADFKNTINTNSKLDEVLTRLDQPASDPVVTAPVHGISKEDVNTLVQQEIARTERVNQEAANLTGVESKLRKLNGESAAEVFNAKAADVGMSPAQLTTLAKVSPQAVLALFNKTEARNPPPTSDGVDLSTVGDIGDHTPKKEIMFGASTSDVINEWRLSASDLEE